MALEMQKLQREHGFNPILGCLPMLAQVPVFLGLYHVLRSFNRTPTGIGQLRPVGRAEPRRWATTSSAPTDVGHFLDAQPVRRADRRLHDAARREPGGVHSTSAARRSIAVGVPVMILAGIATYFNSRASVARQSAEAAANPQTAMMNKLALYVFPLGVVVGGPFLPLAIIIYWFANNIWTFGQQHYVFGDDRERRRGEEAGGDRAPGGERAGAGRQAEAADAERAGGRQRFVGEPTALTGTAAAADRRRRRPTRQRRVSRAPRPGAKPKKRSADLRAPNRHGRGARTSDLTGRGPGYGKGESRHDRRRHHRTLTRTRRRPHEDWTEAATAPHRAEGDERRRSGRAVGRRGRDRRRLPRGAARPARLRRRHRPGRRRQPRDRQHRRQRRLDQVGRPQGRGARRAAGADPAGGPPEDRGAQPADARHRELAPAPPRGAGRAGRQGGASGCWRAANAKSSRR